MKRHLALAMALVALPLAARAESLRATALVVSPAIIEPAATPGASDGFSLRVTNSAAQDLPIQVSAKAFEPQEATPASDRPIYDASAWFSFDEPEFILRAGVTKTVTGHMTVPTGAAVGGHYATIIVAPLVDAKTLTQSTAYLAGRVGVLAFMTVRGALDERLSIGRLDTPRLRQSGPIDFNLVLHNEGNIHLRPNGSVTVRDWRGRVVQQQSLPLAIVLPHSERSFGFSLPKRWLFGRYMVTATIDYANPIRHVSASRTVWVLPWLPIIAICLVLALLLVAWLRRHPHSES